MYPVAIPSRARRIRPVRFECQHSAGPTTALELPLLPRFHPANFPSQDSNLAAAPVIRSHAPLPPLSPWAYRKQHLEAQWQMYLYQRELVARPAYPNRGPTAKQTSPRLIPVTSPGPVTPFELEDAESYLAAGANTVSAASHGNKLAREETLRRNTVSLRRPTSIEGDGLPTARTFHFDQSRQP